MPSAQLNAGQAVSIDLVEGDKVQVGTGASGIAVSDPGTPNYHLWTLGSSSFEIGPFGGVKQVFIYATIGSVTYSTELSGTGIPVGVTLDEVAEYLEGNAAKKVHRHDWSEIDNVPSGTGGGSAGPIQISQVVGLQDQLSTLFSLTGNQGSKPTPSVLPTLAQTSPSSANINPLAGLTITGATWSATVTNKSWTIFDSVSLVEYVSASTSTSVSLPFAAGGRTVILREFGMSATAGPVVANSLPITVQAGATVIWGGSVADVLVDAEVPSLAMKADATKLYLGRRVVTAAGGTLSPPTLLGTPIGSFRALGSSNTLDVATPTGARGSAGRVAMFVNVDATESDLNWMLPEGFSISKSSIQSGGDGIRGMIITSDDEIPSIANSYPLTLTNYNKTFGVLCAAAANSTGIGTVPNMSGSNTTQTSPASWTFPTFSTTTDQELVIVAVFADTNGANLVTNVTAPTSPSGFTEQADLTSGYGFCPVEISTKTMTTAGAVGALSGGTIVLGSGSTQYLVGAITFKGKLSGGGGAQAAVGSVQSMTFASGAWGSAATVATGDGIRTSDGHIKSVTCQAAGTEVAFAALESNGTGQGYYVVRDVGLAHNLQEFIPEAGILSFAESSDGRVMVLLLGAPANKVVTLRGQVGRIGKSANVPDVVIAAPASGGDGIDISGDGLKMAVINAGKTQRYARTSDDTAWQYVGDLQSNVAAGSIGVAISRDASTYAVGVGSGLELLRQNAQGVYEVQDTKTHAGETSIGRGVALNDVGTTVTYSGRVTGVAVTTSGAIAGELKNNVHTKVRA